MFDESSFAGNVSLWNIDSVINELSGIGGRINDCIERKSIQDYLLPQLPSMKLQSKITDYN